MCQASSPTTVPAASWDQGCAGPTFKIQGVIGDSDRVTDSNHALEATNLPAGAVRDGLAFLNVFCYVLVYACSI